MVLPPDPPPRTPDELAFRADDQLDLFARVEGLVGQEAALLGIPAHERDGDQQALLDRIGQELDRVFATLRERARRIGHAAAETEL